MKYESVWCFKLTTDMDGDGVREFVYDVDGPAFLERELVGLGVDRSQ